MELNCLLKDKCVNVETINCMKCMYNRDIILEDNFEEKSDETEFIRQELKDGFDSKKEQMKSISESLIERLDTTILDIILMRRGIELDSNEAKVIRNMVMSMIEEDEDLNKNRLNILNSRKKIDEIFNRGICTTKSNKLMKDDIKSPNKMKYDSLNEYFKSMEDKIFRR